MSGDNQTAGIGSQLAEPLVAGLTENGAPAVGKVVVFKVLQNDGELSANGQTGRLLAVNTDANGHTAVQFTLGSWAGAGNNQVEAMATGFVGVARFSASALAGDANNIVVDSGNNQIGATGQSLPKPFVVVVIDRGSNRLGGVPVTFRVIQGGGNFDGQSEQTVTTDSDGRAAAVVTLGPDEGFENNLVEASFPDNPGFAASFTASGKTVGEPQDTKISGVVLDNSNNPIEGVTLHVEGTTLTTQSDEQGQFVLQPAPVGKVSLVADGSTAPPRDGKPWPKLVYDLVTIAGRDNTIGMSIYLLPIDTPRGLFVDETHGGTLTLDELPGFALTIIPGSATFPDNTKRGTVSVTLVHADKVPMVPNFGQQPRFIITIQPPGTHFNPPAPLIMPNVDGLAPGQKAEMYSFDHDLGSFVSIGPATVSEDGTVIKSDPGVGVVKGGWHCGGNPQQSGSSGSLKVLLSRDPLKIQYGDSVTVTAMGKPPLDAEYTKWKVTAVTMGGMGIDNKLEFIAQPNCPDQSSCSNTLVSHELLFDSSHPPVDPFAEGWKAEQQDSFKATKAQVCGFVEATVEFTCTTTGQKVTDTIQIEQGCRGLSATDCRALCDETRHQGNCGTPCEFLGIPNSPFITTGQCWKKRIGGQDICYYDYELVGGPGFQFLCCPNRCFGDSFTVWAGAGDIDNFDSTFVCSAAEDCNKIEVGGVRCDDVDIPGGTEVGEP